MASVKNKAELHLVVLMKQGFSLEYTTQIEIFTMGGCANLGKSDQFLPHSNLE